MRISLASIFVANQDEALDFYTRVLGFEKKTDIPMGEFRWLTVVNPGEPGGVELVLEPNAHPAAASYQKTLYEEGIPATSFSSSDVQGEYEKLRAAGVEFRMNPTDAGGTTLATFDDTCGNWIQIHSE